MKYKFVNRNQRPQPSFETSLPAATKLAMKYSALSPEQKTKLQEEVRVRRLRGEDVTCRRLSVWCKQTFRLASEPGKSTIARILKQTLPEVGTKSISKAIRARDGANPKLEASLFAWVCDQANQRRMISGPMITAKGIQLQQLCNAKLPREEHLHLTFSGGWLTKFKRRWGLKHFKCHGESGDADSHAVETAMPHLQERIKAYARGDVYNADECGLFYNLAPDRTVALQRPQGRKKAKDRITVMVCCNSDGSDKHQLFFIGTAQKPRAFKKKTADQYGLAYRANKRAWMTAELFFEWLRMFNERMGRQGRRVLLLVDNCSAHGRAETLPKMDNVEVLYLPPNTTSKIQPCDAGIIASLKVRYRRYQMERAIDLVDEGISDIYRVDVLSAMLALQRIWKELPPSVMKNCWEHTGLCNSTYRITEDLHASNAPHRIGVESCVARLVPTHARIEISQLLNPEGENECVEEISDNSMVERVVVSNDPTELSDDDDEVIPLPSFEEQLASVALVKRMCETYNSHTNLLAQLGSLQRSVRLERAKNGTQTTMTDFFSK